jgi:hypothetical protein
LILEQFSNGGRQIIPFSLSIAFLSIKSNGAKLRSVFMDSRNYNLAKRRILKISLQQGFLVLFVPIVISIKSSQLINIGFFLHSGNPYSWEGGLKVHNEAT